jgi:hypothetical protein
MGVKTNQKKIIMNDLAVNAGEMTAEKNLHAPVVGVPFFVGHRPAFGIQPKHIPEFAAANGFAPKKIEPAKHRMLLAEGGQLGNELRQTGARLITLPFQPTDFIVLAIGIVVAALRAAAFVSRGQHRHTLGNKQSRQKIALLPAAHGVDLSIIGDPFCPAVPAIIILFSIPVIFTVCVIVSVLLAHEVGKREAIVGRDEVNTGMRCPARGRIKVRAAT